MASPFDIVDAVIAMPWCGDFILIAPRLLCHGAAMAFLSWYDYNAIMVRWHSNATTTTKPSFRLDKAMPRRWHSNGAVIDM